MDENKSRLAESYDYLKHLTTLSSSSIVVIATFAEKFGKDWKALLRAAIICMLISLLCSIMGMLYAVAYGKTPKDEVPQSDRDFAVYISTAALFFLFLGFLCIGLFGMRSL